jgi:hypothetical protein
MWVPGGRGEITPETEFVIPTKQVFVTERPFNEWMLDYHPARERLQDYADSPMRFQRGWKNIGDLLAWKLEHGFYAAFSHEVDEGIVRVFPKEICPGANIWAWGENPAPGLRKHYSGSETNLGYVEMWGGITPGFDKYHRLGAGESLSWTESMYPFIETKGLHFADEDFALAFSREKEREVTVRLCPAGDLRGLECRLVSASREKPLMQITFESAYPKAGLREFRLDKAPDDCELVVIRGGSEIVRLRPLRMGSNLHI